VEKATYGATHVSITSKVPLSVTSTDVRAGPSSVLTVGQQTAAYKYYGRRLYFVVTLLLIPTKLAWFVLPGRQRRIAKFQPHNQQLLNESIQHSIRANDTLSPPANASTSSQTCNPSTK
jgi:hypothetical protein